MVAPGGSPARLGGSDRLLTARVGADDDLGMGGMGRGRRYRRVREAVEAAVGHWRGRGAHATLVCCVLCSVNELLAALRSGQAFRDSNERAT
jgi:hypothetical protein